MVKFLRLMNQKNPWTLFKLLMTLQTFQHLLSWIPARELIGFNFVDDYKGLNMSKTVKEYNTKMEEFLLELSNGGEESINYSALVETYNAKQEDDKIWSYEMITGHRHLPHKPVEVQVLWSNGEQTWEKAMAIKKDDLITLAKYAHNNDLVGQPGWKWAKSYKINLEMIRSITCIFATRMKKNTPHYKFGVRVPHSVNEVMELDKANGNTLWAEAIQKEMDQLQEFGTFHTLYNGEKDRVPKDYTFIPMHTVFDVKFDGRCKA